ncbi:hypothetical protein ABIB00_003902 [Bradyrhizobium sp. LB14.3]|uniref:hypothetical protein n=1 Tax=Bradyrhizobium sp. LB14.3 TaxID=3156328 RepID=UPI0033947074
MQNRRRFKQTVSLAERLFAFAEEARERASCLPPGPAREELMKKVRQAEMALRLEGRSGSENELPFKTGDNDPPAARRYP